MIRIALSGASGRMGQAILGIGALDADIQFVQAIGAADDAKLGRDLAGVAGQEAGSLLLQGPGPVSAADVVIDFSAPKATALIAEACAEAGVPLVCGTTGLSPEALASLRALSATVPIVHAPNMSVGVTLLFHLAELAARLSGPDFDAEIVEMHHKHKVDAPSGTALALAERVTRARELEPSALVCSREGQVGPRGAEEVGVMTLRGGSVVGEHTLILAGEGERIELTHRAGDRSIFARGAIRAAKWVQGRPNAFYSMADVIGVKG